MSLLVTIGFGNTVRIFALPLDASIQDVSINGVLTPILQLDAVVNDRTMIGEVKPAEKITGNVDDKTLKGVV